MKTIGAFYTLFIAIFVLSACHHHAAMITQKDLLHHRYLIVEFDEQQINSPTTLEFSENFTVNGHICNIFSGQGVLHDSKLTIMQFRSTEMLCHREQLNQLETVMYDLLKDGANLIQYELSGNVYLELKNNQHNIRLKLSDVM